MTKKDETIIEKRLPKFPPRHPETKRLKTLRRHSVIAWSDNDAPEPFNDGDRVLPKEHQQWSLSLHTPAPARTARTKVVRTG